MSACYECSFCGEQYNDFELVINCCAGDKAAHVERERIVAWLRTFESPFARNIADDIEAEEHWQ